MDTLGDVKLYPGGGRAWDWNETGTHHSPGIQPADVMELLENGAEVVVLGCGMERALGVCPKTLSLLAARGVDVHIEATRAAGAAGVVFGCLTPGGEVARAATRALVQEADGLPVTFHRARSDFRDF